MNIIYSELLETKLALLANLIDKCLSGYITIVSYDQIDLLETQIKTLKELLWDTLTHLTISS